MRNPRVAAGTVRRYVDWNTLFARTHAVLGEILDALRGGGGGGTHTYTYAGVVCCTRHGRNTYGTEQEFFSQVYDREHPARAWISSCTNLYIYIYGTEHAHTFTYKRARVFIIIISLNYYLSLGARADRNGRTRDESNTKLDGGPAVSRAVVATSVADV